MGFKTNKHHVWGAPSCGLRSVALIGEKSSGPKSPSIDLSHDSVFFWLVVSTPLKNMSSSIGIIIPN